MKQCLSVLLIGVCFALPALSNTVNCTSSTVSQACICSSGQYNNQSGICWMRDVRESSQYPDGEEYGCFYPPTSVSTLCS